MMDIAAKNRQIANSYYNLGLEKAKVRDLSGAAQCLKKSLHFSKYQTDARNLLGLIYYENGEVPYLVKLPVPLVPLEKIPVPALHLPKLHKELFRHFQLVGFALPVLKADKIPCAAFRGFLPKRVCLNPVCHPVVLLQKMSEGISIPHPVARRMAGCFRSYKIFRSFFRRWSNLA